MLKYQKILRLKIKNQEILLKFLKNQMTKKVSLIKMILKNQRIPLIMIVNRKIHLKYTNNQLNKVII
jgi:hypothetical protein